MKNKNQKKIQKKNKKSMSARKGQNFDINLHETMNASDWANEYKRRFGGKKSLLMGWFANAIMCGWEHGYRQSGKEALDGIALNTRSNIARESECAPAFSSVEDRSLTVAAAQAINDFMAASDEHTVSLEETSCSFFDNSGESLICSASAATLSSAVDVCYENWVKETIFAEEEDADWLQAFDAVGNGNDNGNETKHQEA